MHYKLKRAHKMTYGTHSPTSRPSGKIDKTRAPRADSREVTRKYLVRLPDLRSARGRRTAINSGCINPNPHRQLEAAAEIMTRDGDQRSEGHSNRTHTGPGQGGGSQSADV